MAGSVRKRLALVPVAVTLLVMSLGSRAADPRPASGPDLVVIDPGHGGPDYGARGVTGLLEKDVALEVARRIGRSLEQVGVRVLFTRSDDRFVPLPERTELANRERADLYLSIHANASDDREARGPETYFLSLEASDHEARRVALTENRVFDRDEAVPDSGDLVGAILGDLIRTEHLRASSRYASAIQRELERLPGPGRGVKQAPFVVLTGVNMPAALLEIGFLTHPEEERKLRSVRYQIAIADAVAAAVAGVRMAADPGTPEAGR